MLKIIPIPCFKDNYIWFIVQTDTKQCAIVDPGSAEVVLQALAENHWQLSAILITHHHWDHSGGVVDLLNQFSVPVYGPARENIPGLNHPCDEQNLVTLSELNFNLKVLDIPGHTLGHIAYYNEGVLFCGDTLFTGGCGRVFEGTHEQMLNSLHKLTALPDETLIYCGHEYTVANLKFAQAVEPNNSALLTRIQATKKLRAENLPTVPATLALEKATNPFLRTDNKDVIKAVENYAGCSLETPVTVFAALREWKNCF